MSYEVYMSPFCELYHHGIKGQKWGVRRYQNSDGTYTEEGQKRRYRGKYATADDVAYYKNKVKETKPFSKARAMAKKDLRRVEDDYAKEQKIANDFHKSGWTEVHNAAAASSQRGLDKLNEKYENVTSDNVEAYAREYAKLWNNTLASELVSRYGDRFKPSDMPTYWGEQTIKEFVNYYPILSGNGK